MNWNNITIKVNYFELIQKIQIMNINRSMRTKDCWSHWLWNTALKKCIWRYKWFTTNTKHELNVVLVSFSHCQWNILPLKNASLKSFWDDTGLCVHGPVSLQLQQQLCCSFWCMLWVRLIFSFTIIVRICFHNKVIFWDILFPLTNCLTVC